MLFTRGRTLLYMHFRDAGNSTAKGVTIDLFTEIEVTNRTDGLYIRHHFRICQLSRKRLLITMIRSALLYGRRRSMFKDR